MSSLLAYAELAEPCGRIFIGLVKRLKPTREFRQWTLVDSMRHCLLAATVTEWVVSNAPCREAAQIPWPVRYRRVIIFIRNCELTYFKICSTLFSSNSLNGLNFFSSRANVAKRSIMTSVYAKYRYWKPADRNFGNFQMAITLRRVICDPLHVWYTKCHINVHFWDGGTIIKN